MPNVVEPITTSGESGLVLASMSLIGGGAALAQEVSTLASTVADLEENGGAGPQGPAGVAGMPGEDGLGIKSDWNIKPIATAGGAALATIATITPSSAADVLPEGSEVALSLCVSAHEPATIGTRGTWEIEVMIARINGLFSPVGAVDISDAIDRLPAGYEVELNIDATAGLQVRGAPGANAAYWRVEAWLREATALATTGGVAPNPVITAPTIAITSPATGFAWADGSQQRVLGYYVSPDVGVRGIEVLDGTTHLAYASLFGGGLWAADVQAIAGVMSLVARVRTVAAGATVDSAAVVGGGTPSNVTPTITMAALAANVLTGNVAISGTAADTDGTLTAASFAVTVGGVAQTPTFTYTGGAWSATVVISTAGANTVSVTVTDSEGATATAARSTNAMATPTVTLGAIAQQVEGTIPVTVTIVPAPAAPVSVAIRVGGVDDSTVTVGTTGTGTGATTAQGPGTHSIVARYVFNAANIDSTAQSAVLTELVDYIEFTTGGTDVSPLVALAAGSTATVQWEHLGTNETSTSLAPTLASGAGTVRLHVTDGGAPALDQVRVLNFGFNAAADAGLQNAGTGYNRAAQNVTGVGPLGGLTRMEYFFAGSITIGGHALTGTLDLRGCVALRHIECFGAQVQTLLLPTITSTTHPNGGATHRLRMCFEGNNLAALDLNPVAAVLYDLRMAVQNTANDTVTFATMTADLTHLYHWCDRNNVNVVNMPPPSRMPALIERWDWDTNQSGALVLGATTTDVETNDNHWTSIDISAPTQLHRLIAPRNDLTTAQVNAILSTLAGRSVSGGTLTLTGNEGPTAAGTANAAILTGRGWTVSLDAEVATVGLEISAVSTGAPTTTSATITWTTNLAASSDIDYGATSSYGSQSLNASLVTSHSVTLTGLTAGTTYHYRITSETVDETAVTIDTTFSTAANSTTYYTDTFSVSNSDWTSFNSAVHTISGGVLNRTDTADYRGVRSMGGGSLPADCVVTWRFDAAELTGGFMGWAVQWNPADNTGVQVFWQTTVPTAGAPVCGSGTLAWNLQNGTWSGPQTLPSTWGDAGEHQVSIQSATSSGTTTYSLYLDGQLYGSFTGTTAVAGRAIGWVGTTDETSGHRAMSDVQVTSTVPAFAQSSGTISNVASAVSRTTATISWTTDVPATSSVSYGATTSYGTTITSTDLVTSHLVEITGLTAGALRHYQVSSTPSGGSAIVSSDGTFTTTAAASSGLNATTLEDLGNDNWRATYTWATAAELNDWTATTGATITRGTGNITVAGGSTALRAAQWNQAAAVRSVTVDDASTTGTSLRIYTNLASSWAGTTESNPLLGCSWTTVEVLFKPWPTPAQNRVLSGAIPIVANTAYDLAFWIPTTTPAFTTLSETCSNDGVTRSYADGNTNAMLPSSTGRMALCSNNNATFGTVVIEFTATLGSGDNTAPTVSALTATPSTTTCAVTATTNEAATSVCEYGLTTSYGRGVTGTSATSHTLSLTGLITGTIYHYRFVATDAAGNTTVGADGTFTTN